YTVDFIKRASFLGEDTVLGIVLSFFFGLGIVLLTYIQNQGFSEQSGLNNFLLGRAASILVSDVKIIASVTLILVVTIILLGRLFIAIAFDGDFLSQIGISTKLIQLIISTLTIMTITVGIQAVGIVLIAAIMIIPPAVGRLWSYQVSRIILIGLLASTFSSLLGVYVSYTFPRSPTGPWIVVGLVGCFLFSLLFGTQSSLKVFGIRKI
ncbi:MAG: metal ABC transporter permease, partial [Bacteroidota bacterium]